MTTLTVSLLLGVSVWAQTPAKGASPAASAAPEAVPRPGLMPGCLPPPRPTEHLHKWLDPDHNVPQDAEYRTFHSKTIGHDVSYVVSLPPAYSAAPHKRYAVVYFLSGSGYSPAQSARCGVPVVHSLMEKQLIPEFILVFPNGLNDLMYIDTYDKQFPNETVIVNELIPYIDSTLRTIPDRSARSVGGYSMGGYGAAHLGFGHPDLFGSISILDAALYLFEELRPGPGEGGFGSNFPVHAFGMNAACYNANSPLVLLEKNADKIRGRTFIQVANGSRDKLRPGGERLHAQLDRLHIEHDFALREGMAHGQSGTIDPLTRPDLLEQYLFYKKAFAGVH